MFVYAFIDTVIMRMTVDNFMRTCCAIMRMNKEMRMFMRMAVQERVINDKSCSDNHNEQRNNIAC